MGGYANGDGVRDAGPQAVRIDAAWLSSGVYLVRVTAGGKVPLHPDTRFKVVALKTGSWLDTGLKARLVEEPRQDLGSYQSLSQLLGDQVWTKESVRLEVYRRGRPIGGITLVIKPLAIDLLRKAQAAPSLERKIYFTRRVLKLAPSRVDSTW